MATKLDGIFTTLERRQEIEMLINYKWYGSKGRAARDNRNTSGWVRCRVFSTRVAVNTLYCTFEETDVSSTIVEELRNFINSSR